MKKKINETFLNKIVSETVKKVIKETMKQEINSENIKKLKMILNDMLAKQEISREAVNNILNILSYGSKSQNSEENLSDMYLQYLTYKKEGRNTSGENILGKINSLLHKKYGEKRQLGFTKNGTFIYELLGGAYRMKDSNFSYDRGIILSYNPEIDALYGFLPGSYADDRKIHIRLGDIKILPQYKNKYLVPLMDMLKICNSKSRYLNHDVWLD